MKGTLTPLLLLTCLVVPGAALAQGKLQVAVAADYTTVFQSIAARFERQTGIQVEATFSATGSLYAQIVNGAPYDLFLSADEDRPARLFRDGLGEAPFVYAQGQCVLWSAKKDLCKARDWREAVRDERVKRVALANPETAPYGAAARTALKTAGLWEPLQKKWITAQDTAQAFQYAVEEATDAGFCALSYALSSRGKSGCTYPVTETPAIVQAACLLKRTRQKAAAERLAAFLLSPEVGAIKTQAGYR